MSITSEIQRIKNNISSAYAKAEEKGATMPEVLNSDNLPTTIESITGGGGSDAIINQNVDGISPLYVWNGTEEEWNNGETSGFYNWTSGESSIGEAVATTLPSSKSWKSVAYGNNIFILFCSSYSSASDIYAYSSDGINWTQSVLPSSQKWSKILYGADKFVAIVNDSNIFAYSTDGINWTEGTLPSSQSWRIIAYGADKFITVAYNSNIFAYSTDGINWTQGTLPKSAFWSDVVFGKDKFIIINNDNEVTLYSGDGITWTQGTLGLGLSSGWINITYGNDKFVALNYRGSAAYSSNGVNWVRSIIGSGSDWGNIAYGNGMFVTLHNGTKYYAYSSDGIAWTQKSFPWSSYWNIVYGDNKFIIPTTETYNQAFYIPVTAALSAFTDTETPDTSSTVYSAPSVESSLTITETGTNTITLSDENVYDRNQAGDVVVTQTIGEAHPDYISFIDGVGVKIGTTDIADM